MRLLNASFWSLQLTGTDSDSLHKLLSPRVCPDNQRQVGLLNELVNGALQIRQTRHKLQDQLEPTLWQNDSDEPELVGRKTEKDKIQEKAKLDLQIWQDRETHVTP